MVHQQESTGRPPRKDLDAAEGIGHFQEATGRHPEGIQRKCFAPVPRAHWYSAKILRTARGVEVPSGGTGKWHGKRRSIECANTSYCMLLQSDRTRSLQFWLWKTCTVLAARCRFLAASRRSRCACPTICTIVCMAPFPHSYEYNRLSLSFNAQFTLYPMEQIKSTSGSWFFIQRPTTPLTSNTARKMLVMAWCGCIRD